MANTKNDNKIMEDKMIPLKPCSCGNVASVEKSGEYIENKPFTKYLYFVKCDNSSCKEKQSIIMYSSINFASAAWNRRMK